LCNSLVCAEVDPAGPDAGLELGGAVAAVAERIEDGAERGEEEDCPRRERPQRLLEAEVAGLPAEAPGANELEAVRRREPVDAGLDPLDRVGDHEDLVGGRDIDRNRRCGALEDRGEY